MTIWHSLIYGFAALIALRCWLRAMSEYRGQRERQLVQEAVEETQKELQVLREKQAAEQQALEESAKAA